MARDDGYDLQRVRGHTAGYVLHALAAIDAAIWDALARRAGVPVAAMLSDAPASRVPVYLSGLRRRTREERIELLAGLVANGLPAVKLFGTADTDATLREIDGLRDAVPGDWGLMVDSLWSYDTVDASAAARVAFAARGVLFHECPLVPEDLDAHRALALRPGCPIALGEHFFTHHQSGPWLRSGAVAVFQPDVGRTGLSDGMRQARIAHECGVAVTPHMGSGSPIVQAMALGYWAAQSPDLPCEYQFDLADVLPGVFDTGWNYSGGGVDVPDRPGNGVDVDEAALEAASASVLRWRAP
jgi:galactonate dehydratase